MSDNKEKISEIMNLIGYGLAKFDKDFAKEFGFVSKSAFCRFIVELGLARTVKAVFNRQDSFDPYFDNKRPGWHQRRQREHIKIFIDSLFGNEDVTGYANIVKLYMREFDNTIQLAKSKEAPVVASKFKQMQETGKEAEFYFMSNYQTIERFNRGVLEDARLWGDGYDFQIQIENKYLLAEVKGIREKSGSIRLTQNEYNKAQEFVSDYNLVVISNLSKSPKINTIENPLQNLSFTCREMVNTQINYYSENIRW